MAVGNFHAANSKLSKQRGYNHFYNTFSREFGNRGLSDIAPDEIPGYLTRLTAECHRETKRLRYVQTKAFFNFCINCLEVGIPNPCDNNLLSKSFTPDYKGGDCMEPEKHKIVAYNIVKIEHYAHGHQYAVRLKLDNGELITKRLPGLFPTKSNFNDEPVELQNKAHLAVLNLLQCLHDEGPRPLGKYKTCREAMTAYEEWHGLNRTPRTYTADIRLDGGFTAAILTKFRLLTPYTTLNIISDNNHTRV